MIVNLKPLCKSGLPPCTFQSQCCPPTKTVGDPWLRIKSKAEDVAWPRLVTCVFCLSAVTFSGLHMLRSASGVERLVSSELCSQTVPNSERNDNGCLRFFYNEVLPVRTHCLTNWWDGLLISSAECSVVSGHLPLLSLDEFTIAVSHYLDKNAWFP